MPTEESLEHDARVDEAHWLPPPMWQTEMAPHEEADWLRPGEVKGDEVLEHPPPLKPHLQELQGGKEPSLAGTKVGDDLPALLTSMPEDPEPSPHAIRLDVVMHQTCPDTTLVEGTCEGSWPQ